MSIHFVGIFNKKLNLKPGRKSGKVVYNMLNSEKEHFISLVATREFSTSLKMNVVYMPISVGSN